MIAERELGSDLEGPAVGSHGRRRAIAALSRVEGWRFVRHPAIVVSVAIGVATSVPFLVSHNFSNEPNAGWLLQVGALFVSLAALLAANLRTLRSRRDGTEDLFEATPMSTSGRTAGVAAGALWMAVALVVVLLIGEAGIHAAGKAATNDTGQRLFPLSDLVQAPVIAVLFASIGIAVARWIPVPMAGPVAVVALFVIGSTLGNTRADLGWHRLNPANPEFLADGGFLMGVHLVYMVGLATVFTAAALLRDERSRGRRLLLCAAGTVTVVAAVIQVAS